MQPKPNKREGKKKKIAVKWNKKCASNLQYSSATLIHPPVYITMPFLITGLHRGFFRGTPALAAPGGQLRQPSEEWGSMCRTSALHGAGFGGKGVRQVMEKERVKCWLRRWEFLLCCCRRARGWCWVNCFSCTTRDLISRVPRVRVELQKCQVLLLQMISWEVVRQTFKMPLRAIYFFKRELEADSGTGCPELLCNSFLRL